MLSLVRSLAICLLVLVPAFAAPVHGQFATLNEWLAPARYSYQPHPSVARIIVPEHDGTAYGSGTLVDSRDQYGLVLTNWHVVEGASGPIEVLFPDGFRSQARAVKVDSDWDLAALVIWKPNCQPVRLATRAPQPGDILTICGYGSGDFRSATGRCTQYYSPQINLPRELVELDVEARQGDSGGPILNDRGELAGVLFGAGRGTTLGSFEGRVKTFLASLGPDIGVGATATQIAARAVTSPPPPAPQVDEPRGVTDLANLAIGRQQVAAHQCEGCRTCPGGICPVGPGPERTSDQTSAFPRWTSDPVPPAPLATSASAPDSWPELKPAAPPEMGTVELTTAAPPELTAPAPSLAGHWFEQAKSVLAIIGGAALLLQGLKLVH